MKTIKTILFALIVTFGVGLISIVGMRQIGYGSVPTFAPLLQLFGESTQLVDRAVSKLIPVGALDEKELGETIASRQVTSDKDIELGGYLESLMWYLSRFSKKPFDYRVFVYPSSAPNAFALPGGIIYVTRGLIQKLKSESELIAIMAHEMAHVELGHCFQAVKFELLARKIDVNELGQFADFAFTLALRYSFSKTQEDEADEYAFNLLLQSQYDPRAMGLSFSRLQEDRQSDRVHSIIEDYFATHPSLALRIAKFSADADRWWRKNPNESRYVGIENLKRLRAKSEVSFENEWGWN